MKAASKSFRMGILGTSAVLGLAIGALSAPSLSHAQSVTPNLLDQMFQDHGVLQRDEPINVWGQATAGSSVSVRLGNGQATARADALGAWHATLPAQRAGGPYQLSATANGVTQTISDVMMGDVWLCSGQSNMEWSVRNSDQVGHAEVTNPDPNIRLLTIGRSPKATPQSDYVGPDRWHRASADTAPNFSAVCYFFGADLARTTHVAQGLISSNWGGSRIEPWIEQSILASVPAFGPRLAQLNLYGRDERAGIADYFIQWQNWWNSHAPASAQNFWQNSNVLTFRPVPKMADYQTWGNPALANYLGQMIFRKSVTLTAEQATSANQINLGGMDELDLVWVNGQPLNQMFGWGDQRIYAVPTGLFHAGNNEVIVQVRNTWGAGGMFGPVEIMKLSTGSGDVNIGDGWEYADIRANFDGYPRAPWEALGGLATLYNGMLAPLGNYGMKGALWYQGESNTDNDPSYEMLLGKLFQSFRNQFGADLPVFVVQLPNFGAVPTAPTENDWATIREAERRAVLSDPRSGMAVTIDLGSATNLHPTNKRPVGQRLAGAARALIYGERGGGRMGLGPARARANGQNVQVEITGTTRPLRPDGQSRPGRGAVTGFEVCHAGVGTCVSTSAQISAARRITIAVPANFGAVQRVRYCWGAAPICPLQDTNGQPVSPFELNL